MDNPNTKEPDNILNFFFGNSGEPSEVQKKINDLVPSIIYIYDASKKKLSYVNKKVTDILGYEFDDINAWDDHLQGLVFKEDKESVAKELEKFISLKDNETHTYNSRLNHKQGNWRYFRTTGSVLRRNDKGTPESILFIAEDITHTLESEAEIKAAEELIRDTEDLLQFGTWGLDAAKNKLYWSDGLYKLFGMPVPEGGLEISLDAYFKQVSLNDIDALQQKINSSFESKTDFEHIYTISTVSGQEKIVSTKGKAVLSQEGELLKFIGTTRDITEQINAYSQLFKYKQITQERERFLESGSWELDVPAGKLGWSEGMYRLFGYEPPEDIAASTLTLDFFFLHKPQADIEKGKEEWLKIIQEKENYIHDEIITANDGKTKRLETYGKIVRDDNSTVVKVIGITKDITQLKEYERQLERRLADLEISNKELEEFAYIASHDLQEPLRKISTFGNRIKLENEISPDNKTYLTRMLLAADNMRTLINNLLEFSRVAQRQKNYENTDLNTLLEEVKNELELEIEETGTVINADKLPRLDVVPLQIKQLLSNIILNAIKFRKQGQHAEINIKSALLTDEDKEEYSLKKDETYFKINISDNGIGFEQEYAEKIFKIFQRLHGKAEYPGTGVGLAICRKITDNHNGKLFATGTPGEGSTFVIILPEQKRKLIFIKMSVFAPIRVLIVDDDEDDFFLTSEYIRNIKGSAFVIDWCFRYKDALESIKGKEYDIYFIDYRLGAKTGLDLLKDGLSRNCEEPMILLTGNGNQAIDMEAMHAGATDYLVKSDLNTEKLERCIRYALDRTTSLKRLKANERKFRNIFEKSKDVVFIADEALYFRDINSVACELFGRSREQLLHISLYELLANREEIAILKKQLDIESEVDDKELEFLKDNDEKVSCILSVSREVNITGEKYTQGIIHDITNIKKAEKATLQAEKLRAAGRLVSTLAHEVRNPLNNISLAADQLRSEANGENAGLFLDIINRNGKRINSLISELLYSSGPAEILLQKHTLQAIVKDTISIASDRITLKNIALSFNYNEEPLYILADAEKLKIAFLNIIINAIEAMPGETGHLSITIITDAPVHKVIIEDNGCGINEENLSRLFEPYFTSKRNGLGLGLASTLNIIQAHKAVVDVKSLVGEGTTFTLSFSPAA